MKYNLVFVVFLFFSCSVSGQSNDLVERNFDIESVIMDSSSLTQIMSKINFSFEQYGDKTKSDDGRYVTVRYKNSSLITPLVTYSIQGDVTQIIFLMPIKNSSEIGIKLIKQNGTTFIDGTEVIQKGSLTYDIRSEGDVGIFVIY